MGYSYSFNSAGFGFIGNGSAAEKTRRLAWNCFFSIDSCKLFTSYFKHFPTDSTWLDNILFLSQSSLCCFWFCLFLYRVVSLDICPAGLPYWRKWNCLRICKFSFLQRNFQKRQYFYFIGINHYISLRRNYLGSSSRLERNFMGVTFIWCNYRIDSSVLVQEN